MSQSCHTYEGVVSPVRISHVFEDVGARNVYTYRWICYTCNWVMSHTWMSQGTQWMSYFMSRIWFSHVAHMSESCHIYEWVMSQTKVVCGTSIRSSRIKGSGEVVENIPPKSGGSGSWDYNQSIYQNQHDLFFDQIWISKFLMKRLLSVKFRQLRENARFVASSKCLGKHASVCGSVCCSECCSECCSICCNECSTFLVLIVAVCSSKCCQSLPLRAWTYRWISDMNESCHAHEWVTSHLWISHITHINESCHACGCVFHIYEWVMSQTKAWCGKSRHIHTCEWIKPNI